MGEYLYVKGIHFASFSDFAIDSSILLESQVNEDNVLLFLCIVQNSRPFILYIIMTNYPLEDVQENNCAVQFVVIYIYIPHDLNLNVSFW